MRFLRLILLPFFLIGWFTECFSKQTELSDYQILALNSTNSKLLFRNLSVVGKDIHYVNAVSVKTHALLPNTPPNAADDALSTNEDVSATVNVTANDIDSDGSVNVTTVDLDPSTSGIQNSLTVTQGGFTVDGSGVVTFIPSPNYNGVFSITYTVNDDTGDASNIATIQVTVNPVNDPPTITGQAASVLNETEDTPFQIQLSEIIISDPDVGDVFSLTILPGTNYTFSGTTVTPSANYNGPLTVSVTVSDGTAYSAPFNVSVMVAPVNDPPVITGQTPSVLSKTEDTPFSIQLTDLTISDPDVGDVFTVKIQSGTNYTFSGTTVTPSLNYNGALTVNVVVNDGTVDSSPFGVSVNVANVNDPPTITGQIPSVITKTEDIPFTLQVSDLVITDPDAGDTFTLKILTGTNYTFSGTTITTVANYNGPLTVNVSVNDGTVDSSPFAVSVNVTPVNDPPSITGQVPAILNKTEDTPFSIQLSDLVISDPDNSTFTLKVLAGTNYTFSGTTITPTANFNGFLTVNVVANDGALDSSPFGVTVNVAAVNDPPSITGQSPALLSKTEDTPFSIQLSNLIISDPDVTDVFTIKILTGTNYTFSGTTITPASNYNGPLTVNVTVNDGTVDSAPFGVAVSVAAVNDPPVISGQNPATLSKTEDTPFTVQLSDLIITDPDVGNVFTLKVLSGTNYTFTGNTVTPTLNYNGPLTVNVSVNDGTVDSSPFGLSVNLAAVNDAPQITGQTPLSISESQPIVLQVTQLVIFDPDNVYPGDFTLSILSGANYSVIGNTVIPVAFFSGTLLVKVFVSDGQANSAFYSLQIQVNSVNHPPVITGQQTLTINEDNPITIQFANLLVTDMDTTYPTGFSLTVLPGTGYTFSGNTVTPSLNFNGTLTVSVKVNDGSADSAPYNLVITVTPVNDAPAINGQKPLTTNEDTPITIQFADLTVFDPDNNYPTGFTMTLSSGSNYTVSGKTITPSLNYNGTLTVPVVVNDGSANSNTFNLQITITPVNDPPVITGQVALATPEETPITIVLSNLTVTDPDNTYPTGFSLSVSSGANYNISGNTVTPATNFNGTLTVPVIVNDGTSNSALFNLQIQVTPVNTPPKITGQATLTTAEDTPITVTLANLTVTDPDSPFPTGFTLTLSPGANYTVSGNTITPALNFFGTLTVGVKVNDGSADSPIFSLSIQVTPVNDPPVITAQATLSTNEDTPITILFSNLTVVDPDNSYPTGFTMSLSAGSNFTVSGRVVTPAANYNGALTVPVTVNDRAANSNTFNLSITVIAVNDAPTSKGLPTVTILEDDANSNVVSLLNGFTDVEDALSLLTYTFTNDHPEYFQSVSINNVKGELTFKLSPNAFGTAKITIKATDTGGLFVQDIVTINITPVNDPPSFDPIPDVVITENAALQTITITNISSGPLESQQLLLSVTSGNTALIPQPTVIYNNTGPTATISFKPQPSQTGIAVITVKVVDTGLLDFTRTFQVQVNSVNDPPTLNALSNLTIQEDAPLQNIPLSGISAGPAENQVLTVSVSSNNAALFDILDKDYTSPQATGTLKIKTAADANGTAQVTVTVTDDGSNTPPNVNNFSQTFTLTVQAVNDLPVFLSNPITTAVIGDPYEYDVEISDVDNALSSLTLTATSIPAWMTFTNLGNGQGKLTGTPSAGSFGKFTITLQGKDPSAIPVLQQFDLVIDSRPVIGPFSITTAEDTPITFSIQKFAGSFTDADGSPLGGIQIAALPNHGTLRLGNSSVNLGDEIPASALSTLVYQPVQDYNGKDTINWNGSDGTLYALSGSYIAIVVTPVNDAPVVSELEPDALQYDVGSGPQNITTTFEAVDVDNDSLASAEVGFRQENFEATVDLFLFTPSTNIKGKYNAQAGVLTLTGKAPKAEYTQVIRSIQYNLATTVNIKLDSKDFYITLNDGTLLSDTRDRGIDLLYTFVDLTIPNTFTPGGEDPNNTWQISHSDIEQFNTAEVHVYNKRGTLVFESTGFERLWDGSYKGDLLPADSYFYTIDLKFQYIKKTYKGVVTILHD